MAFLGWYGLIFLLLMRGARLLGIANLKRIPAPLLLRCVLDAIDHDAQRRTRHVNGFTGFLCAGIALLLTAATTINLAQCRRDYPPDGNWYGLMMRYAPEAVLLFFGTGLIRTACLPKQPEWFTRKSRDAHGGEVAREILRARLLCAGIFAAEIGVILRYG